MSSPAPNRSSPLADLCAATVEYSPIPTAAVEGFDYIVSYVNPAFCRLMNQRMEQLVGKVFCEFVSEKQACVTLLDRVIRRGTPASHVEQQQSDPHPLFWSYTMWPARAKGCSEGVLIQMTETAEFREKVVALNAALMLGSVHQHELAEASEHLNDQLREEIDERKRVEQTVRDAGERFHFLAESMPQKIFTAKPTGEVDYFNRQWMDFTGLTFDQIKDWGWKQFIHSEDLEETVRRWTESVATGEPYQQEHRFRRKDGVYRWHLSRARAMRDTDGAVTLWIGSNTEIDDQKHTEEALRESEARARLHFETAEASRVSAESAKSRAETATRAKDDFLAALSHELRTPLNPALLLATSLAEDADLPAQMREDVDIIAKGIALQAQLIDDLLDLTRITGGKLRLDLQPIDAHLALHQAFEILRSDARERQLEVTFDLDAPRHHIKADAVRLQQIFWNVLKNAVKFTPPGGDITIGTRNSAEDEGMLKVEISDTGIGIEPRMLEKVFDSFFQEEHEGAHRFGGVGLGLAITQRLVEVQNGRIRAASPGRNRGATFWIELPLATPELRASDVPPPLAPRAVPSARPRCILLVEDHEQTRSTLTKLLERRGHKVDAAETAEGARALAASGDIDLVISDLGLPDGDGHVLMADLRNRHGLPGIALSGYGTDADLERSRESGFAIHLTKPVNIRALEAAIAASPSPRSTLLDR